MSRKTVNIFDTYEHTEQEQIASSIFSQTNLEYLHNQRTAIAQQKLLLVYDTTNPSAFVQEDAYLRGQLDILSYLIDSSEAATSAVAEIAALDAATDVTDLNVSPVTQIFNS